MNLYVVKTPNFIKHMFNNLVWSFNSQKKDIYLTFDDGPTPEITEWTLKTLKAYKAKATFFCIGKNIAKHPEIYQKIIADNHVVGNHTHNHLNGWSRHSSDYLKNIEKCDFELSKNATGDHLKSKLFRPPYGKIKSSQVRLLKNKGYQIIMWDVLSGDFDINISGEKCLKNVLRNATNGSIIVFHDSKKATEKLKYALPKVLEYFSKKGFQFRKID